MIDGWFLHAISQQQSRKLTPKAQPNNAKPNNPPTILNKFSETTPEA
jgi:hypothetical protein